MAAVSTYLANKLIDIMRGVTPFTLTSTWCALCTSTPTAGTPGTEATYTGYARLPMQISSTTTASSTSSTTITCPTTGLVVGMQMSGSGVSGAPTIVSITSGSALVVSSAQTISSSVALTFTYFTAAASGSGTNGAVITFAACTGGSSTITYFQLYDALTSGNALEFGALTSSLAVSNGITPSFPVSSLTTTMT